MEYGYIQPVICNPLAKGGTVRVRISGETSDCAIFDPLTLEPKSQPLYVDGAGLVPEFVVERGNVYDLYFFDQLGAPVGDTLAVTVNDDVIGVPGPEGPEGPAGESIVGPPGADGAPGAPGADGIDGADGADGVSLVSIRVDENSSTGKVLYNKSDDPENWIEAGDLIPSGLGKVKNSESDSLDFLPEKIVAGEGISISLDETNRLEFSAVSVDDHKVQAHQYSTEANYAGTVLQAGAGIDISLTPDLNRLVIKATGTAVGGFYWKGAWDELTAYNSNNAVWYFDNSVTPVVNRLYIAMEPNQGINPVEDTSGIWSEMMRVDTLGDMFVAVDEDDTQTGYLIDKIRNGSGIVITRHTDSGGNAYLALNSTCLYSVTIGGVTKYSPELAGNISFSAEGGSAIAWDGNKVKISSVALGETSTTAYQGARGKVAYDHSQTSGNPHGTDFSELENKPTTLAGYGITDAQSITNTLITTQDWNTYTQPGVHKVDNWSGLNGPVVGGIASHRYGQLVVERHIDAVTQIYYPFQSDMGFFRVFYGGWGWGDWKTSPNLTDATVKRNVTVSNFPGWYRLGYVDLTAGSYGRVFGSVRCFGRRIAVDFNFSVTRSPESNSIESEILSDKSCSAFSVQRETLADGVTVRINFYMHSLISNHVAFVLYDLGVGGGALLTNAYTHEYIGMTKPSNTELVNCLDRVTLTDASGSSTLPIGDMTQPTAIQTLRNNVKQLQSSTTANGVIYADDWNNFTTTGVYKVVNWSGANGPIAGTYSAYKWGQLVVDAYSTVITQTYYPHLSTNTYFRVCYDGAWGGWKTSAPTNYGDVDSSTDWNNLTSTGKYRVLAVSGTNGPSTAYSLGVLLVDYVSDDYIQQTYIPTYGNGTPVCRQRRSGAWGYWRGSISGGTGMSLNTQIHYQSVTAPRTDPNAIYLCY